MFLRLPPLYLRWVGVLSAPLLSLETWAKEGSSQPTHARRRFVSAFKDCIVARRLACIKKEFLNVNEAVVSLWEDSSVAKLDKSDDRGAALPLTVIECFLAKDARVHCLRLQRERENRLS